MRLRWKPTKFALRGGVYYDSRPPRINLGRFLICRESRNHFARSQRELRTSVPSKDLIFHSPARAEAEVTRRGARKRLDGRGSDQNRRLAFLRWSYEGTQYEVTGRRFDERRSRSSTDGSVGLALVAQTSPDRAACRPFRSDQTQTS